MPNPKLAIRLIRHPISFLVILAGIFFSELFLAGKTFYGFDTLRAYYPWKTDASEFRPHNPLITDPVNIFYLERWKLRASVRERRFSFWDNTAFGGMPTIPSSDPLKYLSLIAPDPYDHDLLLLILVLGSGIGMYAYLRELGLRQIGAATGGTAWMFNGYTMAWLEFENVPAKACTLVFTLLAIERWLRTREASAYIAVIFAVALSLTTGYHHLLIYQLFFLSVYLLYRCLGQNTGIRDSRHGDVLRPLLALSLAFFLGACASIHFVASSIAFVFSPDDMAESIRKSYTYQQLITETGRLPWTYLSTMIFPDLFGSPIRQISFPPMPGGVLPYNNYNEMCMYSGVVSVFLALPCLTVARTRRFTGFFFSLAGITVLMAMGTILYRPLAEWIPGLGLSSPLRLLHLFGFAMAVLAGIGADVVADIDHSARVKVAVLWISLAVGAVGLFVYVQSDSGLAWVVRDTTLNHADGRKYVSQYYHSDPVVLYRPLILVVLSLIFLLYCMTGPKKHRGIVQWLLVLLLAADLISFGRSYNTMANAKEVYPATPAIQFLQQDGSKFRIITLGDFLWNSWLPFGIEDIGGYASFYPRRYAEYLHLSQYDKNVPFPDRFSRWTQFRRTDSPLLEILNVKYVLTPPRYHLADKDASLVYDGEIRIYQKKHVAERIFFVPNYVVAGSASELREWLRSASTETLRHTVALEQSPPTDVVGLPRDSSAAESIVSTIAVQSFQSDRVLMEVTCESSGFLVLSDNFDPRWRASVDGAETPILRGNYIMKAIPLFRGTHRVEMSFPPPPIQMATLYLTIIGWIMLTMSFGVCLWKDRRSARQLP